jgi:hypothetical protein
MMRDILLYYLRVDRMDLILRYKIKRIKGILGRPEYVRYMAY